MDKTASLQEFVGNVRRRICSSRLQLQLEPGFEPGDIGNTGQICLNFKIFLPRRRAPKDDLGGNWVNNHTEPGFFRRRRILRFFRRVVQKDLPELPFFSPKGRCGIRWERVTEEFFCRSACSFLRVTLYFELPAGCVEELRLPMDRITDRADDLEPAWL